MFFFHLLQKGVLVENTGDYLMTAIIDLYFNEHILWFIEWFFHKYVFINIIYLITLHIVKYLKRRPMAL